MFALVVDECANAAPLVARNDDLARSEGTLLYEDGRDRTAASVELGFHHRAFGRPVRIGLEIEDFGLQQDRLEQLVEVGLVLRRNLDVENLTAHGFDEDLVLQQLGADLLRIRGRLVDLVDRHDDRNAGRLAWLIDSIVCGITLSSAATTRTAMSVAWAPRARMAVKAAWPGVSMKVIFWPFCSTW